MKVRKGAAFVAGEHVTGLRPSICPAAAACHSVPPHLPFVLLQQSPGNSPSSSGLPPPTGTCYSNFLSTSDQAQTILPITANKPGQVLILNAQRAGPQTTSAALYPTYQEPHECPVLLGTAEHPGPRQAFPSLHLTLRHSAGRPLPSHPILTSSNTAHTPLLNPRPSSWSWATSMAPGGVRQRGGAYLFTLFSLHKRSSALEGESKRQVCCRPSPWHGTTHGECAWDSNGWLLFHKLCQRTSKSRLSFTEC